MDNKAQVSFEYIIVLGAVMMIAAIVTLVGVMIASTTDSIRETSSVYARNAIEMLK